MRVRPRQSVYTHDAPVENSDEFTHRRCILLIVSFQGTSPGAPARSADTSHGKSEKRLKRGSGITFRPDGRNVNTPYEPNTARARGRVRYLIIDVVKGSRVK